MYVTFHAIGSTLQEACLRSERKNMFKAEYMAQVIEEYPVGYTHALFKSPFRKLLFCKDQPTKLTLLG